MTKRSRKQSSCQWNHSKISQVQQCFFMLLTSRRVITSICELRRILITKQKVPSLATPREYDNSEEWLCRSAMHRDNCSIPADWPCSNWLARRGVSVWPKGGLQESRRNRGAALIGTAILHSYDKSLRIHGCRFAIN